MKVKAHLYILMSLDAFTVWQNNIRNHLPAPCCSNPYPFAQSELRSAASTFVSLKPLGAVPLSPRSREWEGDHVPGPQLSFTVLSWWWHHVQMTQECPDPPLAHCMPQGCHSIWAAEPWSCGKGLLMEAWMKCAKNCIPLILSTSLKTALKSHCNPLQTPQGLFRLWNCPRLAVCPYSPQSTERPILLCCSWAVCPFNRNIEYFRLEGTFKGHLFQVPCRDISNWIRFLRALSLHIFPGIRHLPPLWATNATVSPCSL